MMLLSRFWYFFLGLLVAGALYVAFLAVGQYNRRNQVAMTEGLASDSQVLRWALQIDARRRLDALLPASVDKAIQESLVSANGKDKIVPKWRDDARKALDTFNGKLPAEYRYDSLFVVDRDGRVVGQVGFDQANAYEDFELGGYPAVNDALHGYLRDDTWVLGGRIYRVSARPVEYDVSQPPAGAVVGLRLIDARFAAEMSKLTRTNVVFYAGGIRLATGAGTDGFDDKVLEQVSADLTKVEADKTYNETGRSGVRLLGDESAGVVFARFEGEAWEQRAGFAVARMRVSIDGPTGFLSKADDKDKASAPRLVLILVALGLAVVGIGFSFLEHSLPLNQVRKQAARFKKGEIDLLPPAKFRGLYRPIAADINAGVERIAEKGGVPRKLADVDAIIGPLPAQPSMSAFSFPGPGEGSVQSQSAPAVVPASNRTASQSGPHPGPSARTTGPGASGAFSQREPASRPGFPVEAPSRPGAFGREPPSRPVGPPPVAPRPPPPSPAASLGAGAGGVAVAASPPKPAAPPHVPRSAPVSADLASLPPVPGTRTGEEEEAATMVGSAPLDVMARASGNEESEWLSVYEDFIRTKKQCGEPTDGLTFEKFQHTLKKNRDALIQRHGCKRVRFSVYVKEGRASLKATPVKD